MKKTVLALIATFAIPMGIAATESAAHADPIAPQTVARIGQAVINESNKLFRDAHLLTMNADKADQAADAIRTEAVNVSAQARALHYQGLYLLRDQKQFEAAELCHEARGDMVRVHNDLRAAWLERANAARAQARATHHQREINDLKEALANENDPAMKANITKLIRRAETEMARDQADARTQLAHAQQAETAARANERDANRKKERANQLVPNSCEVYT